MSSRGWQANESHITASITPETHCTVLVIAMNALMALPFVYGTLAPALRQSAAQNDRLCAGLGLKGVTRFRIIDRVTARQV